MNSTESSSKVNAAPRSKPLSKNNQAILDSLAAGWHSDTTGTIWRPNGKKQKLAVSTGGYYVFKGAGGIVRAHRLVGFEKFGIRIFSCDIDHRDGNKGNNAWSNLRLASRAQNLRNKKAFGRSRFLGVSWHRQASKWLARIKEPDTAAKRGKYKSLGLFKTEEEAARAFDRASLERDPEFARLNFPELREEGA